MFLEKYLKNPIHLDIIYSNYDKQYLNTLDEENFLKIYKLFKSSNFYFIKDIILNYLEIFDLDYDTVFNKIIELKKNLGDNYINIIANDLTYLEEFLK